MCLRFSTALITGAVLAVSTLAHAKTQPKTTPGPANVPAPAATPATGLAQVQAIFLYCELVDPHSAANYQRMQKVVLSGSSSGGGAYLTELGTMAAALAKVPVSSGVSSCRTVIAGL